MQKEINENNSERMVSDINTAKTWNNANEMNQ